MPRFKPYLTDGVEIKSIYDWRKDAKREGFIFEAPCKLVLGDNGIGELFRIINFSVAGKPKVMKSLRRIKII